MKKRFLSIFIVFTVILGIAACDSSRPSQTPPETADQTVEPAVSSVLIDAIQESYSGRAFKEAAVPDAVLEAILQSGQKAPSAGNAQPWHFTVIKDTATARQISPRHYSDGAVVIVISGKSNGRFDPTFDCALAAQNIYLAAQFLGLGARMYYGGVQDVNDNRKGSLGIPDDYSAEIILLVGYLDDNTDAVTSASPRRPLAENVNYIE